VFATDTNVRGTTDDTHAHFPNEGLAAETHDLYSDGNKVRIVPDLDALCSSHIDYVATGLVEEEGCVDDKYGFRTKQDEYVDCEFKERELWCWGIQPGDNKIIELKGYPNGVNAWIGSDDKRWAYENFHFNILEAPLEQVPPTSNNARVSTDRGEVYTFEESDFEFNDQNPEDTLQKVIIFAENQGDIGILKFDGETLEDANSLDDKIEITASEISLLTFTPTKIQSNSKTILRFFVNDGQEISEWYNIKMSIKLTPIDLIFNPIPDLNLQEDFSKDSDYIHLRQYCSEGQSFSILSQSNSAVVDCKIAKISLFCRSVPDGFGENELTISCSDPVSTPTTQTLKVNVENTHDSASLSTNTLSISLSEGSSRTSSLPIVNPDKETFAISSKISPRKGSVEYTVDENGNYLFTYDAFGDATGSDSFTYYFYDGNNEIVGNVNVNIGGINDKPLTLDNEVDVEEDREYTFRQQDFPYSDPADRDPFHSVLILSYPQKGDLKVGSSIVSIYDEIGVAQIGNLKYIPEQHGEGQGYTQFLYAVSDGLDISDHGVMTVNVDSSNDQPTIEFIDDVTILEDSLQSQIFVRVNDVDEDELSYTFRSSDQLVIKDSNIVGAGSGNNPILLITPEADVSDRTTTITVFVDDRHGEYASESFDVYVEPINDAPSSSEFEKSAYVYDTIDFYESDFVFNDPDGYGTALSTFTNLEIISTPSKGELRYNDEVIRGVRALSPSEIENLDFDLGHGIVGNTSFKFRVYDGHEYSDVYDATLNILPSPYGLNSQPARFGGYPIYNTGWACKPGYEMSPEYSSLSLVLEASSEVCQEIEKIPPVANISVSVNGSVALNTIVYFSGAGSVDPDGTIRSYDWTLATDETKSGEQVSHFYTSLEDCPSGICTIKLNVTDNDGESDEATTQLRLLLNSNESAPDYSGVVAVEGDTYTDGELAHLGLVKGQMRVKGGNEITVDSSGKITNIKLYEGSIPGRTSFIPFNNVCEAGELDSSTPLDCIKGNGVCSSSKGETSINSPDCEGSSKSGLLVLLIFLTILGGGAFYAWKKGLLGSHNVSIGAKPTTASTMPAQPVQPSGPGQYIKTQRAKGFSNEQIRGALKNKGWDDDKIDEALNSSRE